MSIRFSLGQSQRQEQKQILTQRLIQSMELLQLPLLQLEERIETELQTNPVLEAVEHETKEDFSSAPGESDLNGDSSFLEKEEPIRIRDSGNNQDDFQTAGDFAETYSDTIDESPIRSQNWLEEADQRHQDLISGIASRGETLEEHLHNQLDWFHIPSAIREKCETVIGSLDRFGFLSIPLEDLWDAAASEEEKAEWQLALQTVQKMDPRGIGARTVQESLLLQVPDELPNKKIVRNLIGNHFDNLLHNRVPLIQKETGYTISQIEQGLAEIKKLNPRPGSEFDDRTVPTVLPDVFVEKNENGDWVVDVNDGNLIKLGINSEYAQMLRDKEMEKEAKEYLRRNIGQAKWLIEALKQRKMTLLRVARAIVAHQIDFFEIGPEKLHPLKMQQIADELGIHIATVSRACDEKWIQGPRGIYPFKHFFTGSIKTESENDDTTSASVKMKIRKMVENEDKKNPLSDEEIAAALNKEGIEISRRTVAKYRDALNIPSSRQRKNWG